MKSTWLSAGALFTMMVMGPTAWAQTGVDDDRVSLPEGPGSIEGVGDNVELGGNMGAMSYRVNIGVPRGRRGMAPDVSLSYSSSGGVGVVGIGWSMATPSIERMTARGVPDYDADDLFAANGGDELVWVETSGGEQIYRERYEGSFVRYTWKSVGTGDQGYWTAQYPDGSIGYFGADADGNLVDAARGGGSAGTAKYHLVEMVDPFGNRLVYGYDKLGGTWPLISKVDYVFDDEGEPEYSVSLSYEVRPDPISDGTMGYEDVLGHRLVGIRAARGAEVSREVALSYAEQDGGSLMSRLSGIEQWGKGGKDVGLKDPIHHTFGYQKGLGSQCEDNCVQPYMVDMGTLPGGVSLASGFATLIDINGDALPDVLDTSQNGAHRFFLNELTYAAGEYSQAFSGELTSAQGDSSFQLGDKVQTLDVNGDGFSDLVNVETGAFLLKDPNSPDWLAGGGTLDADDLKQVDFSGARFIDIDMDKRIDVLTSAADSTQVLYNTGSGFERRTTESIGQGFADSDMQLADLNGDGLNDVVDLSQLGLVRFRLNLSKGDWTEWRTISGVDLSTSERDLAELEDLNGDGRDDIVVVTASQISYALNLGDSFADFVDITSAGVTGDLPERGDGVRVLYSDMNANGSEDVVWFLPDGSVQFLELFPQRANLMSELSNGIGFEQRVTYGTAAQQAAKAAAEGNPWARMLQMPMPVVDELDIWASLSGSADGSGLHEIQERTYHDAYYDGDEKQFRGFATVTSHVLGDEHQESATQIERYNLGDVDPYIFGQMAYQEVVTGNGVLNRTTNTYALCDLTGLPTNDQLEAQGRKAIGFPCMTETLVEIVEGLPDEAVTTATTMEYDGYGNVVATRQQGVVGVDGDEMNNETTFATPRDDAWFLRLPILSSTFVDANGDRTEERYYYDGDDFVGLAEGEFDRGFLTRATVKADDDTVIETMRARRDGYGNVVETIDPNGSLGDDSNHRRVYTYDDLGLFVVGTALKVDGYELFKESRYDYVFQKPNFMTDWILVEDGQQVSARLERSVVYDDLGRMSQRFEPGDAEDEPSIEVSYDIADPVSRFVVNVRGDDGAPHNTSVKCMDGRGRTIQTRTLVGDGEVLVDGFLSFNRRGAPFESYQTYRDDSLECATSAPQGVRVVRTSFDGLFRPTEITRPDGDDFGGQDSVQRFVYAPLRRESYDEVDTDVNSPLSDTPTVTLYDGLNRVVSMTRTGLEGDEHTYMLHYDSTGSFEGYTDPAGNRHTQVVDLAGRVTRIENANFGAVTLEYDDAGNITRRVDGRGVEMLTTYDGMNRVASQWAGANADATRITWTYDRDEECVVAECTNTAGRLASVTYPMPLGDDVLMGQARYGYDARGRDVWSARVWGGLTLETRRTFDNSNRLVRSEHPAGVTRDFTYDGVNRPLTVSGFVDSVVYDDRGSFSSIGFSNGARTSFGWDALTRLRSLSHEDAEGVLFEAQEISYDRVGNVLEISDVAGRDDLVPGDASFAYDAYYRVLAASVGSAGAQSEELSFAYDALDNVLGITSSLEAASPAHVGAMTYSSLAPNAIASAGDVEYTHEGGFMSARGDQSMEWEHRGGLDTIEWDERYERFLYGEDHLATTRLSEDGLVLYVDGDFEVRDGVAMAYVQMNGSRVGRETSTALMTSIYPDGDGSGGIDALDAWLAREGDAEAGFAPAADPARILGASAARMLAEAEDTRVVLHADYLGSLTGATGADGSVRGQRAFYPMGMERWSQGWVDVYGFTGQEHSDSGLIRYAYRHLDPKTGRWTRFDPAFESVTPDKMAMMGDATAGFAYVAGKFATMTDPLGLHPQNGNKGGAKGGGGAASGGAGAGQKYPEKRGLQNHLQSYDNGSSYDKYADALPRATSQKEQVARDQFDSAVDKAVANLSGQGQARFQSGLAATQDQPGGREALNSMYSKVAPTLNDGNRQQVAEAFVKNQVEVGSIIAASQASRPAATPAPRPRPNEYRRQRVRKPIGMKLAAVLSIGVLGVLSVATLDNPFDGNDIGEGISNLRL